MRMVGREATSRLSFLQPFGGDTFRRFLLRNAIAEFLREVFRFTKMIKRCSLPK